MLARVISPGRTRLSYLSAEGQWTRVGVIEIGTASVRLLVADRRPAHTIPLWDHNAPVPAETHGYQLRTVTDEVALFDVTRGEGPRRAEDDATTAARRVAALVERAEDAECVELHVVCDVASGDALRLDAAQTIARAVGRPVHLLTPRRAGELLALGAAETLDAAADELLVRCGGTTAEAALTRARRRVAGASLPVGVETLAARHSHPPREGELKLLRQRVRSTLSALPPAQPVSLVAAAEGGVALLPALAGITEKDTLTLEGVRRALRTLQSTHPARLARSTRLPLEELKRLPSVALILEAFLERFQLASCRITPRGLRHGVLIAAAEDPEHWWVDLDAARLRRERLESASAWAPSSAPAVDPERLTPAA